MIAKQIAESLADHGCPRRRDGRGMVTAELAVATLTALAVLTMLSWGIYLVVMQMRCIDTAGEVARQAARGDKAAVARAKGDAPSGAVVSVQAGGQVTTVRVRLTARPFASWLVSVPLTATAEVMSEPGREWRAMKQGRGSSERGGGSMLMIGVMAVVLFLSLGAMCIAGYLVAAHRARTAADLAALSGASAYVTGDDACRAAKRMAEANGAHLATCDRVGDPEDFVVSVRVEVTVGVRAPLPRQIGAAAHAGSGTD